MSTNAISITTDLPVVKGPDEWPDKARAIEIVDQASYERASQSLLDIKALTDQVHETFDPICQKADKAHKEAVAQRKKHLAPLETARAIIGQRRAVYEEEQRRIEREEQRRLEAEARKAAEEEQLAAAIAAEAAGASAAEVEAIVNEEPVQAPMPVATQRVQRVAGVSTTTSYSAEVYDIRAFLKWVGEQPGARAMFVDVRAPTLNKMATAMKDSFRIPGCRLVKKSGVRTRG
jgi:hypothetical protein